MTSDWGAHSRSFELNSARIVAVLEYGGGAVVEHVDKLVIQEGRVETHGTDGQGQSFSGLDYMMTFYPKDADTPDEGVEYHAHIVVSGVDDEGRTLEIRGTGYFGHDDKGSISGQFHELPAIVIPTEEDLKEHLERKSEDWGPTPVGEFVMASYAYNLNWG